MTVEYLDIADFVAIAAEVTGLDVDVILKVANLDLADSALHAPSAGFGDEDFYPDFVDKAAVLIVRLAKNLRPQPEAVRQGDGAARHPLTKVGTELQGVIVAGGHRTGGGGGSGGTDAPPLLATLNSTARHLGSIPSTRRRIRVPR